MFNWFKKDAYPERDTIRSSPIRNQYFHRIARYHWMDEQEQAVVVMHPVDAHVLGGLCPPLQKKVSYLLQDAIKP